MNENNSSERRQVDDAGIRLAPTPLDGAATKRMPAVVQEFVLAPRLDYAGEEDERREEVSTASDYQPKERDAGRRWKRSVRTRNFLSGTIMLIASAAALLPFILAAADVTAELPFKLIPEKFDVISGWIDAFRVTAEAGWKGEAVNAVWAYMVPDILLTVGLIAVLVNVVKAVTGMFGAIKPRRYTACAAVFLLSVIAVFIAALAGAEDIGLEQMDFMEDFIRGWQTNEFFTLFAVALINVVLSAVCSFITPLRTGYTRIHDL